MRDPEARIDRRAWVSCVACPDGRGCQACGEHRLCEAHWRYLLQADGSQVFLQCPACLHRWWHDTGFGAGRRPLGVPHLYDGRDQDDQAA